MQTGQDTYSQGSHRILEAELSLRIGNCQEFTQVQDALRHSGTTLTASSDTCEAIQLSAEEILSYTHSQHAKTKIAYSSNLPILPVRQLHQGSEYQELIKNITERGLYAEISEELLRANAMCDILLKHKVPVTMTIHEASLRQYVRNAQENHRIRKIISQHVDNVIRLLLVSDNIQWAVDENRVQEQAYYELPNDKKIFVAYCDTNSGMGMVHGGEASTISTGKEAKDRAKVMTSNNEKLREHRRGNDYLMGLIGEIRRTLIES